MSIKNLSPLDIVLVRYPFSVMKGSKIRPAIIISSRHRSEDIFIIPLTSRTSRLQNGEFILDYWKSSGLNVPSAVKRGLFTISASIVIKVVGRLHENDARHRGKSIKSWLYWK